MDSRLSDIRLLSESSREDWLYSVEEAAKNAEVSYEDFTNLCESFDELTDLNIRVNSAKSISYEQFKDEMVYCLAPIGFTREQIETSLESSDIFRTIKTTIQSIWLAVKKALLSIIKWVKTFYDRYIGQVGEISRACQKARAVMSRKQNAVPNRNVVEVKDVSFLIPAKNSKSLVTFAAVYQDLVNFGMLRKAFNEKYMPKVTLLLKELVRARTGQVDIRDTAALSKLHFETAQTLSKLNASTIQGMLGQGSYNSAQGEYTVHVIGDKYLVAKDYVLAPPRNLAGFSNAVHTSVKVTMVTDYANDNAEEEIKFQAFTPSMISDLIDYVEKIYSPKEMEIVRARLNKIEEIVEGISKWVDKAEKIALEYASKTEYPQSAREAAVAFFKNQIKIKDAASGWTSMISMQLDSAAVRVARCCLYLAQAQIRNLS